MSETLPVRRYLVQVKDCIFGETIYPRIRPHERLLIDPSLPTGAPASRRQIGTDIYGIPIFETIAAQIPSWQTYDAFQVVSLIQRKLKEPNVDRIVIKAV